LAGIAALIGIIHTLQMLHLFPISLGPVRFFTFDLLGAILWGINAAVWLWVVTRLWNMDPQGWMFVVLLSSLNLILAVFSLIGGTSFQDLLPSLLVNGAALLYSLMPGTKAAFGKS
jgi:hypothetical protein